MNKSIKNLWTKALRSGRFKQGKKTLKTPDGKYCCLGVLTNLYLKEKKKTWKLELKNWMDNKTACINQRTLPQEVRRWAGLKDSDPAIMINTGLAHCSNLNDDMRLSFKEIADVIEEQL